MATNYVFVRIPRETFKRYQEVRDSIVADIKKISGKDIKLPMTRVFHLVVSKEWNENYIQLDLQKLMNNGFKK